MKIKPKCVAYSILCLASHGPSFGAGDICIRNNANKTMCSSNLGSSYKQHSQHVYGSVGARSFLAGLTKFQLSEICIDPLFDYSCL